MLEGERSLEWLAACLAAGNSIYVAGGPRLVPVLEALRAAGVPHAAMQVMASDLDPAQLLALARSPRIDFAVADAGEAAALALHEAMGPTAPGARGLKALLTSLEGPQPGEAGFARRFAHPRAIAICTLRHGADLGD
jgi:inactivated superfamily I helicase